MNCSDIIRLELPEIKRVIEGEVARETRRRGYPVSRRDPAVVDATANLILSSLGQALRRRYEPQGTGS